MLDDAASKTHGSPEWWLLRLGKRLAEDAGRFDRLESYWLGQPPMPHGNRRMREAYRRLQRQARTNFGALIAEAVIERMKVVGFRAGGDASDIADKQAWKWWQANSLDADAGLVHRAAVVLSRAYVIVGPDPEQDDDDAEGEPLVTVEDPRQVIHESSPTNRRRVIAALKTYWDDVQGEQIAVLYLPNDIYYFKTSGAKSDMKAEELWKGRRWDPDTSVSASGRLDNPLGEVPVTPFVNRPDMSGGGLGEFEDVIDILDRINTLILDRLVVSAMQAYRQRWAKGVRLTDEDGNDTAAFDPGADLLWVVEDDNAQFGEFSATDLTPIVKAIESDVQYLSAITRTPPHYVLAGIVNASGDALSVAETGLVSKLIEREQEFGESWERVYRHASKLKGKAVDHNAEVLWRDPQFRSLTEMASASIQLKSADVPWRTRMRLLDMTPGEIDRMESERMQDAMTNMLLNPALAFAGQPGQQPGMPTTPGLPTGLAPGPTGQAVGGLRGASRPTAGDTSVGSSAGGSRSSGAGKSNTALGGSDAAWRQLYEQAKSMGIRGASKMTKQQLQAVVGG